LKLRRSLWLAKPLALMLVVLALGGCAMFETGRAVKTGTVKSATLRRMESLNMDRKAPVLVRIYKQEQTLEVWKQDRTGRYALLTSYPICRFSGGLGPKVAEGDHQAPEGFYEITPASLNPFSREYLSFNIGYPNAYDRSLGRTGSFLMVHGGCRSVGCYAMTDSAMDEIYGLVYEAFSGGQQKVQIQALPFRMTAENLTEHRADPNMAFWSMLKKGDDAFQATLTPPKVAVCGRQYVFNTAYSPEALDPAGPCPAGVGTTAVAGRSAPGTSVARAPIAHEALSQRKGDTIGWMLDQQNEPAAQHAWRPL
jgi:murein L,D-transpeptidase YafK